MSSDTTPSGSITQEIDKENTANKGATAFKWAKEQINRQQFKSTISKHKKGWFYKSLPFLLKDHHSSFFLPHSFYFPFYCLVKLLFFVCHLFMGSLKHFSHNTFT